MNKVVLAPSSAIWLEGIRWHAQITIYAGATCNEQVDIKRSFDDFTQANKWRSDIIELLKYIDIEVQKEETA